jgi:hypothetical protein
MRPAPVWRSHCVRSITGTERLHDVKSAVLVGCPETVPFHDHLLGRIAWVASGRPARGTRLRELFAEIPWS